MFCFPCYIFLFKLMLNHILNLKLYYVADVEALVPSMDYNIEHFSLRHYFKLLKEVF